MVKKGQPVLSEEAMELVRSYFRQQERFDLQYTLGAYPEYTGEEVVIYDASTGERPRYILLPERDKVLQADMNATDQAGNKLVILTRSQMEGLYLEIFDAALSRIRETNLDIHLFEVLSGGPASQILDADAVKAHVGPEQGKARFYVEAMAFIERLIKKKGPIQSSDAVVVVLAQYLVFLLEDAYQPCVDLGNSDQPVEPDNVPRKILIKYTTKRAFQFKPKENITNLILGFSTLDVDVPQASTGSSHFRLRAPVGLVFTRPLRLTGVRHEPGVNRNQIHLYARAGEKSRVQDGSPQSHMSGNASIKVRLNQTMGSRVLLLMAYILVTVLPPAVAIISGTSIGLEEVEFTSRFLLPVVVALVAASWAHAHLRTFAVFQLFILVALLAGWLLVAIHPALCFTWAFIGLVFVGYNLLELLAFPAGLEYSSGS